MWSDVRCHSRTIAIDSSNCHHPSSGMEHNRRAMCKQNVTVGSNTYSPKDGWEHPRFWFSAKKDGNDKPVKKNKQDNPEQWENPASKKQNMSQNLAQPKPRRRTEVMGIKLPLSKEVKGSHRLNEWCITNPRQQAAKPAPKKSTAKLAETSTNHSTKVAKAKPSTERCGGSQKGLAGDSTSASQKGG